MERILMVPRAIFGAIKTLVWLLRDSESDVADLYPQNQARGDQAATRGSLFASMTGVGHP